MKKVTFNFSSGTYHKWIFAIALSSAMFYALVRNGSQLQSITRNLISANSQAYKTFLLNHFLTPVFALFVLLVLLLEYLKPAQTGVRVISRGFIYDASIGLIIIVFQFLIVNATLGVLFYFYARVHKPLLYTATSNWSNWLRAVSGILIGDFLCWASHLTRHKVPALWRFHAMHHSQRELNIFTEFRSHPLDSLLSSVMQSLPLYLTQIPFSISVGILVAYKYFLMFTHSNIDVNLGFARYLFVSPVYHRVHHASEPELHDCNYGAVFSIWDNFFRTARNHVNHVPRTGVDDFPTEHDAPGRWIPTIYLLQLIAPFQTQMFRNRPERSTPAPPEQCHADDSDQTD